MAEIKLKGAPQKDPAAPEDGKPLTISAVVSRSDAGELKAGFKHDETEMGAIVDENAAAAGQEYEVKYEIAEYSAETHDGTYSVWAKGAGATADLGDANLLTIGEAAEPPAGEEPPAGVELRDLVWDKNFAANTGVVVFFVIAALATICALAASYLIGKNSTPEDIAGVVALIGVFLGGALIVGGGWVVALEARGRASKPADDGGTTAQLKGLGKAEIEAVTGLAKAIGQLRGHIAMIIVGALLVGGMAWLMGTVATDDDAPPTTTVAPGEEAPDTGGATDGADGPTDEPAADSNDGG